MAFHRQHPEVAANFWGHEASLKATGLIEGPHNPEQQQPPCAQERPESGHPRPWWEGRGKWLHLHILLSSVALEAAHGVVHVLTCVANVHTILLTARDECPDPAASPALIPTFLETPTRSLPQT